jgi:hypothetical protein
MNEAELRAKIKAELLAELEAKQHSKEAQDAERARLNAAMNPMLQSARRVENSQAIREDYGAQPGQAARDYGAVLAMQMLRGQVGTGLADDGYGDGEAA